jgi:hypothetical protein
MRVVRILKRLEGAKPPLARVAGQQLRLARGPTPSRSPHCGRGKPFTRAGIRRHCYAGRCSSGRVAGSGTSRRSRHIQHHPTPPAPIQAHGLGSRGDLLGDAEDTGGLLTQSPEPTDQPPPPCKSATSQGSNRRCWHFWCVGRFVRASARDPRQEARDGGNARQLMLVRLRLHVDERNPLVVAIPALSTRD